MKESDLNSLVKNEDKWRENSSNFLGQCELSSLIFLLSYLHMAGITVHGYLPWAKKNYRGGSKFLWTFKAI